MLSLEFDTEKKLCYSDKRDISPPNISFLKYVKNNRKDKRVVR